MNPVAEDILMHYGVKRRSGRYPWGSGDSPYQRSGDFLARVQELKKQGLSETDIVKAMKLDSSTQLRVAYRVAKNDRRRLDVARAHSLKEDGLSYTEIGRKMGINESSVRSLLNEGSETRMNQAQNTAQRLKDELKNKHMIDVGAGVERELGVSKQTLQEAIYMLEAEGYVNYGIGIPQVGNPGKQTNTPVLCEPGTKYGDVYKNMGDIQSIGEYHSVDGGKTFDKREYPASIDSKRVQVRYGDEGGTAKDGVIEIRRGVQDLNLGNSHYAQVRILVDGTHYLKGMAIYSDDIPEGSDIVFNTNKKKGTPLIDGDKGVLKPIKNDPDNPFGAYIKAEGQSWYDAPDGTKKLSAINKLKEEGDWDKSSRNLSSQFLSKQPLKLINKQLDLTYADKKAEFDEIMSIQNPTVRKKMLAEFADSCDSAVIHLKAAALPRQETRVILPITAMKDTEVYAPYLKDGEKVVLIRYPHGGTFEIPELTVNNKNKSAKNILGNATDAIGINSKVAERLSGADFDGDTVVVIPVNSKVKVKTTDPLDGLKDFDPKTKYAEHPGMKVMTKSQTQREMGIVSNLITDMTLQGASTSDIAAAVRHSMVVIDAAKHKLDYKQSEIDNNIAELKKRYQPKYDDEGNVVGGGGAHSLLSKRKQTVRVPERQGAARIDKDTGEVTYKESGRTYKNSKGQTVKATTTVPLLSTVDDVRTLSSGTTKEDAYANYANRIKSLANQARKEYMATKKIEYSPSAKKVYETEVESLNSKLRIAELNAPKERRAQAIANSVVKAKIQAYPELADDKKTLNKVKQAAIYDARASVGASGKESRINITDREWDAIQAGAISDTKASQIFRFMDPDSLKQRALPKTTTTLSSAKVGKIEAMSKSGYTIAQIAESLGVSTSTVSKYLNS